MEPQQELSTIDDESLMGRLVLQQMDALSELYDRYSRLLFSIALSSVGSPETAEEIVQDVFTRVWEKAKSYNVEAGKVRTWLISITRHRSIDELRRNRARPEQYSVYWSDISTDGEPESEGIEGDSDLFWDRRSVQEAIAALSPQQRQALALAYFKGYSHSEIAEVLGEPLGTVKTRIRAGMQKLRLTLPELISVPD